MTLPSITGEGGLVDAPELRHTDDGKPWCTGRVAFNDRKRDGTGNWVDGDPTFLDFVAFGKPAENFAASAHRGDHVVLVGVLEQRDYQTREGDKRVAYRIKAESLGLSTRFKAAEAEAPPW